jgi:uncharacterized damage-inducible protein DinB
MHTILLVAALSAAGQQAAPAAPDRTTMSGSAQYVYDGIKGYVLKSAEKMPADQFGFQPTPEVRTFGQVLAHIADANYMLCSPALGEPNPNGSAMDRIEKEKLAREPLLARLKESFAYCDRAYAGLTDGNASEAVPFASSKRPRVSVLWFHIAHAFEHYGNLVTYMRIKGLVPPSSERGQ